MAIPFYKTSTFTGLISTKNYGTSEDWNSAYTTVINSSASWNTGGIGGNNYIYTTISQSVSSNRKYAFDTTSAPLTATLPSTPQLGDEIEFFDACGRWFLNPLTIDNNTSYIEQLNDKLLCNVKFGIFKLIFTGNIVGWRIVPLPKHNVPSFVEPIVSISSTIDLGYDPITVGFIGISNLSPAVAPVDNWYWNLTGGSQPDFFTQAVTYTYSTPGVYTVTLTGANFVGIGTATKTITALPVLVPIPTITANALISAIPFNINLNGNNTLPASASPVVNWYWNLTGGDDAQFTTQNVTFTYDTSGVYVVSLSAENASGIGTASITVTALQPLVPVPVISASSFTGSTPFTVTFSGFNVLPLNLSPVDNWYWNLTGGDDAQFTTRVTTFTYTSAGVYTVNLTASNMTGFGTATTTITAAEPVVPPLSADPYSDYVTLLLHFNT